jgi:hypothetical protein
MSQLPSDTRALWNRATELDRQAASSEARPVPAHEATPPLPLRELLGVAGEVGISPDSVLISVAESRLADGGELRPRAASPLWHLVLVETLDALEVSVELPMAPDAAVELLDRVLERPEYQMALEDRLEDDPSGASVSVFRIGGSGGAFQGSAFHGALELADGRVLIAAVVAEPEGGSRVRIRMPLYDRGTNLVLSAGTAGLAGAGGVSSGAALGEAVVGAVLVGATGLLPLAAVVVPAVLGAYVGAGLGILGFRKLQKWGFGKGRAALNRLARTLELEGRREGRSRLAEPSGP